MVVPIRADIAMGQEGPSGFTVCGECEDGWVYPAPHGVDATDCPAFYDICRCEGTPCPSCRGSGLVPTDELRQAAADAARSMWGHPFADLADAVLRVVAEHLRKELAVSDEQNTAEQVVVEAVALFVETVGDAAEAAAAVLDALRETGLAYRHLPTCPECAEVVHDADCRLVGDGRPVEGDSRDTPLETPLETP